jgi:phosphoribosylglycinamide formyltransferase 1
MFNFGWFSSGRDQAAIDLFVTAHEHLASGFIPGRLAYVFCDREPGETPASDRFLAAVQDRGVPVVTHSSRALRRQIVQRVPELDAFREAFDAQTIALLKDFTAEVVVLAGYMLILSHRLCRAFLCLNLHPAVPGGPKGTWQEVMWQIMAAGAREAGGMMHLATPELDMGPPVAYFRFALTGPEFDPLWEQFAVKLKQHSLEEIQAREGEAEPLLACIRAAELRREFPLILLTLKNLAEGRFKLTPGGVYADGRHLPQGLEVTVQVEEYLSRGAPKAVPPHTADN